MRKKRVLPELYEGRYTPMPHAVLDSAAFTGASTRAKALLLELIRQHNGRNNGYLQLTATWLKRRGWASMDQIQKAKLELQQRGLILKTKQGGLHAGPDWYALTWLKISDYNGLDIRHGSYYPGLWREMDTLPTVKMINLTPHGGSGMIRGAE